MSEQNSGQNRAPNNSGNNNNRRHHHNRNRFRNQQGQNKTAGPQAQSSNSLEGQPNRQQGPRPETQGSNNNQGQRRRHRPHRDQQNRNRNSNPGPGNQHPHHGINIERIYEKYLNLLDQHLIARRKYHDLFYRAEISQKAKLERNFYSTLNDLRDFESKLAPEARELFEKRNNGLQLDTIYTSNHQDIEESSVILGEIEDPHFLQSQRTADFSGDTEESVGTLDDYLRYKNLV